MSEEGILNKVSEKIKYKESCSGNYSGFKSLKDISLTENGGRPVPGIFLASKCKTEDIKWSIDDRNHICFNKSYRECNKYLAHELYFHSFRYLLYDPNNRNSRPFWHGPDFVPVNSIEYKNANKKR